MGLAWLAVLRFFFCVRPFFAGHQAEITAMAVSRDGRLVASGERGNRPVLRIWDAQTCVELACLGPFHRQAVSCVAWSLDGRRVASVGADLDRSVALWESASGTWEDARKVEKEARGGRGKGEGRDKGSKGSKGGV